MNKSFIVFVLIMFLNENIFSQEAEHINGGSFSKKIEYNIIVAWNDHCYNLEGKSILDRIFFGITNSLVEFVIKSSFDGASAFRIVDNSSDSSSLIEISPISTLFNSLTFVMLFTIILFETSKSKNGLLFLLSFVLNAIFLNTSLILFTAIS